MRFIKCLLARAAFLWMYSRLNSSLGPGRTELHSTSHPLLPLLEECVFICLLRNCALLMAQVIVNPIRNPGLYLHLANQWYPQYPCWLLNPVLALCIIELCPAPHLLRRMCSLCSLLHQQHFWAVSQHHLPSQQVHEHKAWRGLNSGCVCSSCWACAYLQGT